MANVRQPAVAGTFYPADPSRLRDHIDELLGGVDATAPDANDAVNAASIAGVSNAMPPQARALIAPHAGYAYSGPVAASAFATLVAASAPVRRVVVIGPSHFVPFAGVAVPAARAFDTPLGRVELATETIHRVREIDPVVTWDEPHRREHAVEVELPFLQAVLGDFELVPLVTGSATCAQVAAILDALWDDATVLVVSSDLSHFFDYERARRLDEATAEAIVGGRPGDLLAGSACGRLAIQGLLTAARSRGARMRLLDLRSSGDTAGRRDEVVGYGAFHAV